MSPVVTVSESKGGREVLTLVVMLVLAALWAVVLLPPLVRSRSSRSVASDSIGEFNYKLGVLSQTNGAAPAARPSRKPRMQRPLPVTSPRPLPQHGARPAMAPFAMPSPPRAAKRRADILRGLVIAVALTMALAYLTGSPLVWGVQLLTDVCLAAFLGLWALARNVQADRAQTVRYLPRRRTPELAFRRTASS
jgi:hypothetical protein